MIWFKVHLLALSRFSAYEAGRWIILVHEHLVISHTHTVQPPKSCQLSLCRTRSCWLIPPRATQGLTVSPKDTSTCNWNTKLAMRGQLASPLHPSADLGITTKTKMVSFWIKNPDLSHMMNWRWVFKFRFRFRLWTILTLTSYWICYLTYIIILKSGSVDLNGLSEHEWSLIKVH